MKISKTILIAIALVVATVFPLSAQVEKGQKSLGFHGGYATYNTSGLAGVNFQYAFSRHFVLAASVDNIFSHKNVDGLMFCLDYHGPVALNQARTVYFYHLLGLNYASWKHGAMKGLDENGEETDDVSVRRNRMGLDIGAGFEWYVTSSLRLSLEGKFNWLRHANTGLFSIGISYVF